MVNSIRDIKLPFRRISMHLKMLYHLWFCLTATSIICASSLSHHSADECTPSLLSYIPVRNNKVLTQALQLISAKKIDLNQQDEHGNTFLHLAIAHIHTRPMVQLASAMIRHGASVDIVNKEGKTPRDLARDRKRALYADKKLHENDILHGSPLQIACFDRQIAALVLLFEGMPTAIG